MFNKRTAKTRTIVFLAFFGILCVSLRSFQAQDAAVVRDVPQAPAVLPGEITTGKLKVAPDTGVAGEFGTWAVTYQVGQEPIRTGGGIRIQFPIEWHAGIRNSGIRIQTTEPSDLNYISAHCTRAGVKLLTSVELQSTTTLVKGMRISNLTGQRGYFVEVVRVVVTSGELQTGDTLAVVYGDTSKGSPGMRAGLLKSAGDPVVAALDTRGNGQFHLLAERPKLTLRPGPPSEMLVTATSQLVAGKPAVLHVALLDQVANAASEFSGDIALKGESGEADVPSSTRLDSGRGWLDVKFTPRGSGILRIRASEATRKLSALSNPIEVSTHPLAETIYWGDLHSHTEISKDGAGKSAGAYEYARHVSALEFYAMTDHSGDHRLTAAEWPAYNALAERFNAPGIFATLHAYEISFYGPYGHHNVFFRGQPGPLLSPDQVTLAELWRALKGHQALTIPHHTMKMPRPVDWPIEEDNAELRRNIEIYSGHGLSEAYDPQHPLAFEQSLFTTNSQTFRGSMSAQKAWARGFLLSTIASSDDHRAHPGQPQYGIVAVRARSLTREGIFDALYDRKTYGTTGVRIILDFKVNDVEMGQKVTVKGSPEIQVKAIGTDVIDSVEVLRHVDGRPGFQVIRHSSPADEVVHLRFTDTVPRGPAIYYVRVRQRSLVRERIAMAWSSPIWVTAQ